MSDRRPLLAIGLILVIAFIPSLLIKRSLPPRPAIDSLGTAPPIGAPAPATQDTSSLTVDSSGTKIDSATVVVVVPADTVMVRSALYEYGISTRGGQIVSSRFLHYRSMSALDSASGARDTLQLLRPGDGLMKGRLLVGGDTVHFDAANFTADATELSVTSGPATLRLSGVVRGLTVQLSYTFVPDDYRIRVDGQVTGLSAAGGTLVLGLGNGFRDTEANFAENHREGGFVVKKDDTKLHRFSSLDPLQTQVESGPFEWVAVKSKYFVAALFAWDSTRTDGPQGLIGAVLAHAADTLPSRPVRAVVDVSMPISAVGNFSGLLYIGPMEYDRLTALGRDFDDVNPYGWPGFRTIIRPFAVGIRAVFVWMHQTLGLHYGLAIVAFGILIRILLWPLNQKAMRSMTAMQAIQPEMKRLQEKHKEDPAKLQQEMFKLYKENKVNPFGGCWPMLLPWPFLVAVFFVLANTIELRGVSFLWMTDLSRPDPLYIIPVIMGISMFALSKIGQMGMPPNPQAKMMMYVLPGVFMVMFLQFASGLNLYYAVQNLASLPQQWLIMQERRKLGLGKATPAQVVHTKKK